jgi:hypothetical protein
MADSPVKLLVKLGHRSSDTVGALVPTGDLYVASRGYLELLQALHIVRLHGAEALAPGSDRLLADPVPLRHRRNRSSVRLAENRHHLLVRKPALAHARLR